ncbi:MAG: hypothetical protein AB7V50_10205 [Vampirovibrionia bacterium]
MNRIIIIVLLIFSFCFNASVYADNEDVMPEITSIKQLLKKYKGTQKINLHVNLAILYAKNEDWKEYYNHLKAVYTICPKLVTTNINFSSPAKTNENVIISPRIIQKLSKLNLSHINTKDKALMHLELLKPLCDRICEN